jgi:hypothetical protein
MAAIVVANTEISQYIKIVKLFCEICIENVSNSLRILITIATNTTVGYNNICKNYEKLAENFERRELA